MKWLNGLMAYCVAKEWLIAALHSHKIACCIVIKLLVA